MTPTAHKGTGKRKQSQHLRTSKKGKKFVAGKGRKSKNPAASSTAPKQYGVHTMGKFVGKAWHSTFKAAGEELKAYRKKNPGFGHHLKSKA